MSTAEKEFYIDQLDREILNTEKKAVNFRLERLVEEYARVHGGYAAGMAELGEYLLQHADYLRTHRETAQDVSWVGLLKELMRRSG